jgi:hypothetical protein
MAQQFGLIQIVKPLAGPRVILVCIAHPNTPPGMHTEERTVLSPLEAPSKVPDSRFYPCLQGEQSSGGHLDHVSGLAETTPLSSPSGKLVGGRIKRWKRAKRLAKGDGSGRSPASEVRVLPEKRGL